MTFFEFVCHELLGPPSRSPGDGESYWECPRCCSPKFHTKPHRPPFKDRFKCFRCDFWGDAADLILLRYPEDDYDARVACLHQLHQQHEAWEAEEEARAVIITAGTAKGAPAPSRLLKNDLTGMVW
jgi:hypothetical protein